MKMITILTISIIMILFTSCKEAQQIENEEIAERLAALEQRVGELEECMEIARSCIEGQTESLDILFGKWKTVWNLQNERFDLQNEKTNMLLELVQLNSELIQLNSE